MITLFSVRPSIMLSSTVTKNNYCEFSTQYKVSYILSSDENLNQVLSKKEKFEFKDQGASLYKINCK